MATRQTRTLARFMLAPSVVLLLVWMIVPLAITLWFSFQQYNPLNPIRDGFVGFSNYALFFTNPAFLQVDPQHADDRGRACCSSRSSAASCSRCCSTSRCGARASCASW